MVILILFGGFSSGNHHDMQKWASDTTLLFTLRSSNMLSAILL